LASLKAWLMSRPEDWGQYLEEICK
jgi:hypothetical protein